VDEGGHADWPLVDPAISSPYNLRDTLKETCTPFPENPDLCFESHEIALAWDFDDPSLGYNVYRRMEGGSIPRLYYTIAEGEEKNAPLFEAYCGLSVFYSVSAIVGADPVTGEEIQSPLSEELDVPPCATLEITLNSLHVPEGSVSDGDVDCGAKTRCQTYEAYGWLSFNGHRIIWNNHCDPGAFGTCLGPGPSTRSVRDYGDYFWSFMSLNTGGTWLTNNVVIRIPIQTGEKLHYSFQLWDHDSTSGDDIWCEGEGSWSPATHVYEAESGLWVGVDEKITRGDSRCHVSFWVRGSHEE
jgi:hypothetical protein